MYSVIVLDDEEIVRVTIARYIQKTQPRFQLNGIFSNGNDAIAYIRNNPVDVIITDIRMPEMDGLALAKYVSEHFPETLVILVTGYGEFEYAQKALKYGVFNYLLKPLDFAELTDNLERITRKLDLRYATTFGQDEDTQLFFVDLISGLLSDPEDIQQRFSSLPLSNSASDYQGCMLSVIPDKTSPFFKHHGLEKQASLLLNAIRTALPDYQSHYLFRTNARFFYIILAKNQAPNISFSALSRAVFSQLHLSCQFNTHSKFDSIQKIRAASSAEDTKDTIATMPDTEDTDILLHRAIEFIHEHYADDITREDVADAAFLSSAYFSRFFKQKTGKNFIEYLTDVRMKKAMELLATNTKIGDISKQVGYLSRNRFSINFRQFSGYSPTEYRRLVLKMEESNE